MTLLIFRINFIGFQADELDVEIWLIAEHELWRADFMNNY